MGLVKWRDRREKRLEQIEKRSEEISEETRELLSRVEPIIRESEEHINRNGIDAAIRVMMRRTAI